LEEYMRRLWWTLATVVVASAGVLACSSSTVSNGTLGFNVAESLLVLFPDAPEYGFVLMSSGTGNCPVLQSGVSIPYGQVSNLDYVLFELGVYAADGGIQPLSAGTYTVVDPNDSSATFTPPGLVSNMYAVSTDPYCDTSLSTGSSGTVTVAPFDSSDGGSSGLSYSVVVADSVQITGTYSLTTCLVDDAVPLLDAGECIECIPGPNDAGPCTIPCTPASDGGVCAEP
jgi:hypothetical protein